MRIGLALPHYDTSYRNQPASWEHLKQVAIAAEAGGLDSLWVSDHLFLDWGKYGGPGTAQGSFECWTTLSALAAVTERVRLGSLTLCNDLRNPGLVANMSATLDQLSGGRIDLGLGAGWYEPEYRAAGISFDRPGDRIARLGESAEVIRRLLEGEVLDFDGRFWHMEGAICRPGPQQEPHPPIWFGGKGDYLLKTAARHADGWNFSWIGSVDSYRERLKVAQEVCEVEGRDPATLRRSVGAYVLCGRDQRDVDARYRRLVERTPAGVLSDPQSGSAVSFEEFRRTRVAGTVAEVVDTLGELQELGVEEVIVTLGALPFQLADLEDLELLAAEVAPALR